MTCDQKLPIRSPRLIAGLTITSPHRSRISVTVRAACAIVVVTAVGAVTTSTIAGATKTPSPTPSSSTAVSARSTELPNDPAARLKALEQRTTANPTDGKAWKDLATAYTRRAYETADPSYYPLATGALDRAAKLVNNSPDVRSARANLFLALHNFSGARAEAAAVLKVQPNNFDAVLSLTDATIELGDYTTAAELVDRLVNQRPGVASFSRLSYLRQLNGDILGAEMAMRSAVSSAPPDSIDRAVALAYLGEVLLERGRGDAAMRSFSEALRLHPTSSIAAMGKARLAAGKRDWKMATTTLETLVDRVPVPGALGLLAELARANGDHASETATNQLVDASIDLFRANGAIVDAEIATLLADRGPGSSTQAVAAAKKAYGARRTIFTEDALAWALMQSARPKEALPHIASALATNPAVASVHWHAATIYNALGDTTKARSELALTLRNPWFSPAQRSAVEALAAKLGVPLQRTGLGANT